MLLITTFYLIRMPHIRNSSPPTFHPDVSHPEFCPANVLPYPDVSHPEFLSAAIPPECLTFGILLRRHSTRMSHIRNSAPPMFYLIRMSHIRNSSPPPFHPDVSHSEFCPVNVLPYPDVSHLKFFSAATPPGCLTPGILPRQRSTFHPDISHSEFYPADVPPSPDISHLESCPPTFNLPRISCIQNSVQPTSHLFLHP